MKKIVLYEDNYADEFDVHGMDIVTEEFWNWYIETAKKLFERNDNPEYSFGTNEYIEYDSLEDFMSCFSVTDIPEYHVEIIEKYLGKNWGKGIPELYIEDERPLPWD